MAVEWPIRKLVDLCDSVDYGYTASAKEKPCGPKFLRITDIVSGEINWDTVPFCEIDHSTRARYRLHHGDVVIARTGATTGYSAYISNPPDAVFASYLVRLKVGSEADPHFVSYFLRSNQFWNYMRGVMGDKSAQPNASAKTMTQVTLRLPPFKEQQAIGCILGALDDKIELNRRMNQTLEAMARAIFKSWFVDFDPVRARAAGRQPAGLSRELAAFFPDSFEDSELGEIPMGWEVASILQFSTRLSGGTPKTDIAEYWDGGIKWVSAKDVRDSQSGFIIDTDKKVSRLGIEKSSAKILPANTTVVTARGTVGSYCLLAEPMSINQTNYGLKSKLPSGDYFVFFSLGNLVTWLQLNSYGTIFDTITTSTFEQSKTIVPKLTVIYEFDEAVSPLMERIKTNLYESRTLATLRDTLLPKLISGELRVPDEERIVGRCI